MGDSCSAYGNRNFWRVYNYWFNPNKDFRTMATTRDGVTMVVDRDGTIATSSNLTSWQRIGVAPGASGGNIVSEFGQTSGGNFAILMADGTAFESSDGVAWNPLTVQTTEVNQDIVTRHTVQSGDTVGNLQGERSECECRRCGKFTAARWSSHSRRPGPHHHQEEGVVRTVNSPVILDPSIVISAGASRDDETQTAPNEESQTPAEGESTDSEAPSNSEDSSELSCGDPIRLFRGVFRDPLGAA